MAYFKGNTYLYEDQSYEYNEYSKENLNYLKQNISYCSQDIKYLDQDMKILPKGHPEAKSKLAERESLLVKLYELKKIKYHFDSSIRNGTFPTQGTLPDIPGQPAPTASPAPTKMVFLPPSNPSNSGPLLPVAVSRTGEEEYLKWTDPRVLEEQTRRKAADSRASEVKQQKETIMSSTTQTLAHTALGTSYDFCEVKIEYMKNDTSSIARVTEGLDFLRELVNMDVSSSTLGIELPEIVEPSSVAGPSSSGFGGFESDEEGESDFEKLSAYLRALDLESINNVLAVGNSDEGIKALKLKFSFEIKESERKIIFSLADSRAAPSMRASKVEMHPDDQALINKMRSNIASPSTRQFKDGDLKISLLRCQSENFERFQSNCKNAGILVSQKDGGLVFGPMRVQLALSDASDLELTKDDIEKINHAFKVYDFSAISDSYSLPKASGKNRSCYCRMLSDLDGLKRAFKEAGYSIQVDNTETPIKLTIGKSKQLTTEERVAEATGKGIAKGLSRILGGQAGSAAGAGAGAGGTVSGTSSSGPATPPEVTLATPFAASVSSRSPGSSLTGGDTFGMIRITNKALEAKGSESDSDSDSEDEATSSSYEVLLTLENLKKELNNIVDNPYGHRMVLDIALSKSDGTQGKYHNYIREGREIKETRKVILATNVGKWAHSHEDILATQIYSLLDHESMNIVSAKGKAAPADARVMMLSNDTQKAPSKGLAKGV